MHERTAGAAGPAGEIEREIGRYGGDRPGPTLLVVGALHGNEPAGIVASRRVLARLARERLRVAGEVRFLAGNRAAIERGTRFVETDLNRMWLPERVEAVVAMENGRLEGVEDRELRGLWLAIRDALVGARGGAYLFDLHTSSADGAPFLTVGDTLRNRAFALRFPVPLILGLEEQIDGPLLEFLNNLGLVTLGFEAGRHDDPRSADRMESAIWIALVETGLLDPAAVPDLDERRAALAVAATTVPRVIEVRHRHPVRPGDGFRMEPGFENFRRVRRGQTLAHDEEGPILAQEDGLMLLPLYQGQGDDGFFLAREVSPRWLAVSARLRRLRVGGLFRHLPGVRPHATRPDVLRIDTRVARFFPLELFHLLGYRKLRRSDHHLVVARRRHDLEGPERFV